MSKLDKLFFEKYANLVRSVVKKYRLNTFSDKEDAFQAGCLGLCEALNRFDESKGNQFSTYAVPWITKYVREFSRSNAYYVTIPAHQMIKSQSVYRCFSKLRSENTSASEAIEQTAKHLAICQQEVRSCLEVYQGHQDRNIYLDDPDCLMDLENPLDVVEIVGLKQKIDRLKKRSTSFPKREQEILEKLYFGDHITCDSVTDAGRMMGISKQSAQELHKKAIIKLQSSVCISS